ncbi:hypothetical protein [Aminipila sp.]|uniref:hypothetical protein n=1 Tax=Aminipila sp. TaxID=2060095 RepID=UPI00289E7D35|nr:hypothetical protein [Aminipila sp.]
MAGTAAGSLIFDTQTDTSGFERGTRDISNETEQLSSSFDNVGKAIATAFSIGVIKSFGQKIIETTADLQALDAQFEQIFKGAEGTEALKLISEQSEELGIHVDRLKGSFNQFGAQLKGAGMESAQAMEGTAKATKLAADAAAFYDTSLETSSASLASFLKGNFEAGDAIGVFTNATQMSVKAQEMYGKSWDKLTEAEKQWLLLDKVSQVYELNGAAGQATREQENWSNVTENLRANWERFLTLIGNVLLPVATEIVKVLDSIITGITDLVDAANEGSVMANIIVGVVGGLIALFTGYVTIVLVANTVTTLWGIISGGAAVSTGLLAGAFALLTAPITLVILAIAALATVIVLVIKHWDELKVAAAKTWEAIKATWSGVASWFNETFITPIKKAINAILGFAEGLANGFIDAINKIIQALNTIKIEIPDWVPKIGGNEFGFDLKPIKRVSIPKLASGAVIPPNSEFMAILGDQKHGTNIEAPLSTIEQAVDNVLSRRGGTGSSMPVIIEIDGRELARAMAPYNTGENMRQGTRLINGVT